MKILITLFCLLSMALTASAGSIEDAIQELNGPRFDNRSTDELLSDAKKYAESAATLAHQAMQHSCDERANGAKTGPTIRARLLKRAAENAIDAVQTYKLTLRLPLTHQIRLTGTPGAIYEQLEDAIQIKFDESLGGNCK